MIDKIERNFSHIPTRTEDIPKFDELRATTKELAYCIELLVPDGRDKSLAMTKLEECLQWAILGIVKGE